MPFELKLKRYFNWPKESDPLRLKAKSAILKVHYHRTFFWHFKWNRFLYSLTNCNTTVDPRIKVQRLYLVCISIEAEGNHHCLFVYFFFLFLFFSSPTVALFRHLCLICQYFCLNQLALLRHIFLFVCQKKLFVWFLLPMLFFPNNTYLEQTRYKEYN